MVATGLPACSDSDYVVEPSVPLEDVPEELASAQCEVLSRCAPSFYSSLGDFCVPQFTERANAGTYDQIVQAVDDGRVRYDAKAAADCAEATRNLACDELDNPNLEACQNAFEGDVPRGGECTLDEECEGNNVCVFGSTCPGTCEQRLAAGQDCGGDDNRCGAGLVCSEETKRCIEPAGLGAECDDSGKECATPLFCKIPDGETVGECVTQGSVFTEDEGEACDFLNNNLCKTGLSCVVAEVDIDIVEQSFDLQFQCRAPAKLGETCGVGVPGQCDAGQFCAGIKLGEEDVEGTCEELPGDGQPCADAGLGEAGVCALDAFCDGDTCRALRDNGESCSVDAQCWSENCLNGGCAPASGCQ
jgi:hypothetical protein